MLYMENSKMKEFIEKVKIESMYKKFLKTDIIYQLMDIFKSNYDKINYPNKIKSPLEKALQFYKDFNEQYYKIVVDGIQNGKILFTKDNDKSYVSTKNNYAYIKICENDSDVFNIVHELAHYIDRNSVPQIIPDEYWFLSETFAFYIEKKLEAWLNSEKYKDLISIRRNNRLYYESRMLTAIEVELYYEDLYKKKGVINESDIDVKKIELVKNYKEYNLVNYLLQYPLANIISSFLIYQDIHINDKEFINTCLNIDLYEAIKKYTNKKQKIHL